MEVFKKIGSKERFYEIMSGVNKIKLNEDVMGSEGGLADKAVQELLSGSLDIEQVNNQVNGGESTVEIVGKDDIGSKFIFKFIVNSNETDQQGVNVINDADIVELVGDMPKYDAKFQMGRDDSVVAEINKNYKTQLIDAISEYVEFESDTESISDEMYEEAVKFIDRVPYNKGSEEIQTHKAYADQKPVNPDVRVHSNELEKFVSEEDDDDFALPPDYSVEDMPKSQDDDDSVSRDPYEQEPEFDDSEEATPEDKELYGRAYDNITASGNQFPTSDQIEKEVLKLKGLDKPVEKTRTIPKGAEEFWEGHVVTDIKADDVVKQSYDSLSNEKKKQLIFKAQELVDEALGSFKDRLPRQEYLKNVQKEAIKLHKESFLNVDTGMDAGMDMGVNEEEKKNDYPDQMGKTFKPKSQIPKKKRKPQSVVKLKEDDTPEPAIEPDFDAMGIETTGDQLNGGLGDDKSPNQFDPDQVAKGVKVEMEHTDNPLLAMEIALDHLTEDPEYYGGAGDDPDEMAQTHASQDAEKQEDDELADELLGYKPHNVGDYANEGIFNPHEYSDNEFDDDEEAEYNDYHNKSQDPEIGHDEYLKKSGQMKSFDIDEGGNDFSVGNKVKISDGSGVDSNKTGVIVSPREIKTDGRGVPVNVQGAYKPVDWNREVAVKLDDGNLITMFKNRVHALNELSEDTNKHVVVYDGSSAYVTSEDDVNDDVEIKGRFDNIDDADALVDEINAEAGNLYENVELARQVLKNRRLNEGMTKTDAVQLLIRHNIK